MPEETLPYTIERFSRSHLPAMEALYAAVYGRRPARDHFRRKYDTVVTGHACIGYLALADGIAIGYYGVIPCYLILRGETILSAQSADTMTHPDFRFKGLFVALSEKTFDLCRDTGIRLLFGFPNQHSLHGAIHKLHWKLAHTMDVFVVPVVSLPIARCFAMHNVLGEWYRRYQRHIAARHASERAGIPSSVVPQFGGVLRNDAYLRQKTTRDHRVIRAGNANVWLKLSTVMTVGDVQLNGEQWGRVMRFLRLLSACLGITRIIFQAGPGTELHALLSDICRGQPAFPVLFRQFDESVDITSFRFTFADIDIF